MLKAGTFFQNVRRGKIENTSQRQRKMDRLLSRTARRAIPAIDNSRAKLSRRFSFALSDKDSRQRVVMQHWESIDP